MSGRFRNLVFAMLLLVSVAHSTEIVEHQKAQLAKKIAGIVTDKAGEPIAGVLVEECSSDWKNVARSTTSKSDGHFSFPAKKGQRTYYLQFKKANFDWVRVKVQIDQHGRQAIAVELPVAT